MNRHSGHAWNNRRIAQVVLAAGVIIAAGLIFVNGSPAEPPSAGQPQQWSEPIGAAISVPACGSSSAQGTCSNGSPAITFTYTDRTRGWCNTIAIYKPGYPTGFATLRDRRPCTGSWTWTGPNSPNAEMSGEGRTLVPALNTSYSFQVELRQAGMELHELYNVGATTPSNCDIIVGEGGSCGGNRVCQSGLICDQGNCRQTLSVSCTFSPTAVTTGQTVTWSASASGGTGSYGYSWSGTDGLSGSSQTIQKSYSTAGTKTGSVQVTSGGQSNSASCTGSGGATGVTVTSPAPTITSFTASPSSISSGQSTSLSWSSSNASSCSINQGVGSVPTSGSRSVAPSSTTTYTLTCTSDSGQTANTQTTVTVQTQCSDGVDNDGDGKIDLADTGCTDASDNDESGPFFGPPGWKEVAPD